MDVLINKQYRYYPRISRYSKYPIYYNIVDNKYVSGTTSQLDNTTSYFLYKVQQGDTYDSIALKYYNNPTLYWIILDFNRIQDPFQEPKIGTSLKLPTISNLTFI